MTAFSQNIGSETPVTDFLNAATHPVRQAPTRLRARFHDRAKRGFDIGFSLIFLIALSPVFLVISGLILISDGAPIIFNHKRIGQGGKPFRCFKFRTMIRDSDAVLTRLLETSPQAHAEWAESQKLKEDPRIMGALGRFLRKTSLDELPQLFNVLRGEMSLVGPRPVVEAELVHYGMHRRWYFAARPGLTGPWQISGRSDTSYATRVRLDVVYVRAPSLRRDLGILLRTVWVVLMRRGAY